MSPTEAADPDVKAIRTIRLDPKKKAIYKLRLVPGVATTVQLPERWKETPICGECVFGDAEYKGQLFRLDLVDSTQTLTIKNARLPGPDVPPEGFITNLDVTLLGGATATFFIELTPDPNQADTRVEVTLPDDAKAGARRTAFDREMAAEFEGLLAEKADQAVMQAALFGTRCKDFAGGPRRTDQMVVRLRQMCRNGRLLWMTFEVENRNNLDLSLAVPSLSGENGVASTKSFFEKTTLLFNQTTRGIVAAELVDPAIPSSSYALEVTEDGGRSRTVLIDGIDF
ncbi:MAG: hypothetical protein Q8O67_32665 [Deltaproteobacteria bacterium]|nr:hypothetical protein [Deltaproteobacteria bacterium]